MLIYVPRAFGSVLIINVTPQSQPNIPTINLTAQGRDGKLSGARGRDGKGTASGRDGINIGKGRG